MAKYKTQSTILKMTILAAAVALSGCDGSGGNDNNSTAAPQPAPDVGTPNNVVKNQVVTVDKTVLDQTQQYKLISNQSEQILSPQAVSQTLATRVDAPVDASGVPSRNADTLTLVAVTNQYDNAVLMSIAPADQVVKVNLDTSAEVFIVNTVALAGVKITDYDAFSARVRKQPEFSQIKSLIEQKIKQNSPCPMSNQCNASAALVAERLAAKIDFSDIVTNAGV